MLTRVACYSVAIVALAGAPPVQGGILTSYSFDGSSAAATSVDSNISASTFDDGDGSLKFDAVIGNPQPSAVKSYMDLPTGHFTTTDWFGFSVTPNAGTILTLSAFAFDAQRDQVTGSGGNPVSNARVTLQPAYSLDGLTFLDVGSPISLTANSGSWDDFAIDLSSVLDLQRVSDQTWIRLFVQDAGRVDDHLGLHLDNVVLTGNVRENPEPASILIFGMGAFVLALSRRRLSSPRSR
jgi:hypothetical protein